MVSQSLQTRESSNLTLMQAFMSQSSLRAGREVQQKANVHPFYASRLSTRPLSEATEIFDTDFEDDSSEEEEYAGRRSEESVGNPESSISIYPG